MSSLPYKKDNDNLLIFDGRWQLSQHFINLSISCFPNPPKRQWGLFFAWRKWPMIYWQSSRVLPIMAAPSRISTRWSRHANWTALLISITLISAMSWGHRFWKWDGRSEGNRTCGLVMPILSRWSGKAFHRLYLARHGPKQKEHPDYRKHAKTLHYSQCKISTEIKIGSLFW